MNSQRPESTDLSASDPAAAAGAINTFGLNLFADETAHRKRENVFISPLSVFFALAMTEGGAAGQTRADMRKTLAVPATVSEDGLHQSASALLKALQAQKGVQFSIANALWSDARLPLAPSFVELCRSFYQADATTLDLSSPVAANTINAWVKEKTQGKIPTIVTPDNLRHALAVLTNAVYFKGGWEYKFDKDDTKEGDFHLSGGNAASGKSAGGTPVPGPEKIKKIHFMHRDSIPRAYRSGPGFEAAALPYESSTIALYAILPAPGKAPEEALAKISVPSLRSSAEPVDLDLKLPKFTLDFAAGLRAPLERMGMASAFHGGADFIPMGSPKFFINDVLHKTRLEVDEEGTVAAAATGVTMGATAVMRPREKKTLVFDRPFALLLCDAQTGAILFAGVIYDPQ
ncbi:MAG TPA: serpin family protein [Candidatus Angelobacter sp.]